MMTALPPALPPFYVSEAVRDVVDGVLELLVVPDDLRDVLVDVVHALLLLVVIVVLDDLRDVLVNVVHVLLLLEVIDDDIPNSTG